MNEDLLAAELGTLVPRDQLDGRHTTPVELRRLAVEAYTGLCWADEAMLLMSSFYTPRLMLN